MIKYLRMGAFSKSYNSTRFRDIVCRAISTYLIKKVGHNKKTARTAAVTLSSRFGSALNLNIYFHMLFFDGVNVDAGVG
jgi:hypothetical protein